MGQELAARNFPESY